MTGLHLLNPTLEQPNSLKNTMDHKTDVRERVFRELRKVAFADSRFHYDFGEFIADFAGSDAAVERLVAHPFYQKSNFIFITPDNCVEQLRFRALQDGKLVLLTTYSIRRGFWVLDPARIPRDRHLYASTLDGMERMGQPVTLADISSMPQLDYLVTGTGAINESGIRFGKGHGFFDVEWGMLYKIGKISQSTPAAAVVHDCQILQEELRPEVFDTVVDVVFTPTRTIEVKGAQKPAIGILWDVLDPRMYASIPPLQELKAMEAAKP
jgi:5-formyltetrahydrofolate cyclo-ligase